MLKYVIGCFCGKIINTAAKYPSSFYTLYVHTSQMILGTNASTFLPNRKSAFEINSTLEIKDHPYFLLD